MKVSYVTTYDPSDVYRWSGSGYYIAQCLADSGLQLSFISDLKMRLDTLFKVKTLLYRKLMRRQYLRSYEPLVLHAYAGQVGRQLHRLKPDVVFSPAPFRFRIFGRTNR